MSRLLGVTGLALSALLALSVPLAAQETVWHHALSYDDEVKYPEGFERFDYVNPDAPKAGTLRLGDMGGFDTFNPILPQGEPATGLGLIYDSLMTSSMDEVLTSYGLIAESVSYADDYSWATIRLNPDAKWHDGEAITADDVIWSFEKIKELNPRMGEYYAKVSSAEVTAPGEITFTFSETGNKELPKIITEITVLPKHWWEGTDANGKQRDIGAPTLEPPLGSSAYRIKDFIPGRSITYELVPDYWAANHPTQIGHNNFQEIRYEFFQDLDVQFEAFKADQIDYWAENRAARWATAYDFPAANDGRVVRETLPNNDRDSGVMVGWIPNLRREKFQDQRVREALNWTYDFEELNRTLFYGTYERISSYFFGAEVLTSTGLPEGEELEILESVRDLVPERVFTTPYENPVAGDASALRANLRKALELFGEAGYTLQGNQLVDASGTPFTIELLIAGPTQEPQAVAWQRNLQQIGIAVSIRPVDSAQFIERIRNFDFDVTYLSWAQSMSPGNEQRAYWGSVSKDDPSSANYAGIADPGIDALIDKIVLADDRETLEAATRALDRVLLAHNFVIPSYTIRQTRLAYWNRFSRQEPLPEFSVGFPTIWWWDAEKAAATGGANQ